MFISTKLTFVTILIATSINFSSSYNRTNLFKALIEKPPRYQNSLNTILSYALYKYNCVQVTTDRSGMAYEIMSQMYKSGVITSFINGVNLDTKHCNGYVLITKFLRSTIRLLHKIPRYYGHMIVCLLGGGNHKRLDWFKEQVSSLFRDSEGLLVIFGKKTTYYQRKQPNLYFNELSSLDGRWNNGKNSDYGVDNFKGRKINIATFNYSVFSTVANIDPSGELDWIGGCEYELLRIAFKRLNLTYRILSPPHLDKWGHLLDSGQWSGGILSMVANGTAELAVAGLWTVWPIITSGIEMSFPLGQSCVKLLLPKRKPLHTNWLDIFSTFKDDVWVSLALFIVITAFVHAASLRIVRSIGKKSVEGESYSRSCFTIISFLLFNASLPRTRQTTLKQITIWLAVFSLLYSSCFSCGLISRITSPKFAPPLSNIKELVENDYYWVATYKPDLSTMYNENDPWELKWLKKLIIARSTDEFVYYSRNSKVLYIGEQYENGFIMDQPLPEHIFSQYEASSFCLNKYYLGIAHKRGSPYELPLRKYIHRLHNAGIINKFAIKAFDRLVPASPHMREVFQQPKKGLNYNSPKKLTMNHLKGAFLAWISGVFLATITIVLEVLMQCRFKIKIIHSSNKHIRQ